MSTKVLSNNPPDEAIVIEPKSDRYCEKCKMEPWGAHVHCPKCDSPPNHHEVRNYDEMWRDGDVHCKDCGTYVRGYDAG